MEERNRLEGIRQHLLSGRPIFVYDWDEREGETDMVYYAGSVTWESVMSLRTTAGGLICYATGPREGKVLGLEMLYETLRNGQNSALVKRPPYGDYPTFTVYVNHRSVRTGITDTDRSTTARALHEVVKLTHSDPQRSRERFLSEFMAPGHVPILVSRGLRERKGHTDLIVALGEILSLIPSFLFAEVLTAGRSMNKEEGMALARYLGSPWISGVEIAGQWEEKNRVA